MANEKRLIDAKPLMEDGWHLVKTGKSNAFLASMSLADVPTVDAVEVVHGRWIEDYETFIQDNGYESEPIHTGFVCSVCGRHSFAIEPYCHCGAKMDGGNEDG